MHTIIRNFDVKKIAGIGDVVAKKLHDAGFHTIDLLAHATSADIHKKTGITSGLSTQFVSRAKMALMASSGIGNITKIEGCSECEGRGIIYRDETCPNCNGAAKIVFDDKDPCVSCGGEGIITNTTMDDCFVCSGDGMVTLNNSVSCGICRGTGVERYTDENTCHKCHGQGTIIEKYSTNCFQCGGDGLVSIWDSRAHKSYKTCPTCKGRGYDGLDMFNNIFYSILFSILLPPLAPILWIANRCDRCGGDGEIVKYEGDYISQNCNYCGGDGRISSNRTVDCSSCVDGTVTETNTRPCTACGGDGEQSSTTTARCSACHGLGKTLNVSRKKCNDCQGSGTKIEHHETGCHTCGESGVLKSFDEVKCLRCRGEGAVVTELAEFLGMDLESFVSSPTEDIVATGALDEPSTLAIKRAIGTLYFVLDEPCMRELTL